MKKIEKLKNKIDIHIQELGGPGSGRKPGDGAGSGSGDSSGGGSSHISNPTEKQKEEGNWGSATKIDPKLIDPENPYADMPDFDKKAAEEKWPKWKIRQKKDGWKIDRNDTLENHGLKPKTKKNIIPEDDRDPSVSGPNGGSAKKDKNGWWI